jgi:peroxiredoxin
MALPAPGTLAPDFTLASTSGGPVTLSALRGKKVLLAFFPLAFTSTCTAQMCAFSEEFDRFRDGDTAVLPISVDSVPTLREFKAKERIALDLLSDFKREVSRLYGTLNEEKFTSDRAYVLIDRDGVVRWSYTEASNRDRRQNQELLEQIAAIN